MNDREKILAVFTDELPHTVRLMNAPAVTDEIELGKDVTADDDERPEQEVYDRHLKVLEELADEGILQTIKDWGITAFGLTTDYQERINAFVVGYLENKAVQLRRRMEDEKNIDSRGVLFADAITTERVRDLFKKSQNTPPEEN